MQKKNSKKWKEEIKMETKIEKLKNIVNKHLTTYVRMEKDDFCLNPLSLHSTEKTSNVFGKIFEEKSPNQKNVSNVKLYHYKRFNIAFDFLKNDCLTISALSNYHNESKDDIKEYLHFFEITGLTPDKSFIDKQKDGFFVLCLTDNNNNDRFWKNYADEWKGLCIEFEFINKWTESQVFCNYELRKICYDDGDGFKFYKEMQQEIKQEFGSNLITPGGIAKFAALYKRTKYDWEKETRLLINWQLFINEKCKTSFSVENKYGKKYLKIPFDNELFTIKVKSITLGKNLSCWQKIKVRVLALRKGYKCVQLKK
jgi:hypothetical protein